MGVFRRRCRQLPDLVENNFDQITSQFNNTGGAYGTPHCNPLRQVQDSLLWIINDHPLVENLLERLLVAEPEHREAMNAH
jgi:hypothetical protein